MHLSEERHYEIIHYFLADTEMNLFRLLDYMDQHEVRGYLGENETVLVNDLLKIFKKYNERELSNDSSNADTITIKR